MQTEKMKTKTSTKLYVLVFCLVAIPSMFKVVAKCQSNGVSFGLVLKQATLIISQAMIVAVCRVRLKIQILKRQYSQMA
jgi:hypothetical protein